MSGCGTNHATVLNPSGLTGRASRVCQSPAPVMSHLAPSGCSLGRIGCTADRPDPIVVIRSCQTASRFLPVVHHARPRQCLKCWADCVSPIGGDERVGKQLGNPIVGGRDGAVAGEGVAQFLLELAVLAALQWRERCPYNPRQRASPRRLLKANCWPIRRSSPHGGAPMPAPSVRRRDRAPGRQCSRQW